MPKMVADNRQRGVQYVRLPKNVFVNPATTRTVTQQGERVVITYDGILFDEDHVAYIGSIDGWLQALYKLAINPSRPVVDLDPDFELSGSEQDDLNAAIPDEEATSV